jgi:hypothetical protein
MAKPEEPHRFFFVESYDIDNTSGRRGKRHIRPCKGQGLPTDMLVRCPKELRTDYPLGTKFKIWAKLTDRQGGTNFLSSWHGYEYFVVDNDNPIFPS